MDIAQRQARNGERKNSPEFVAAICSTFGELGSGMLRVQEWLTRIFRKSAEREAGQREDGMTVSELTAQFRSLEYADCNRAWAGPNASRRRAKPPQLAPSMIFQRNFVLFH